MKEEEIEESATLIRAALADQSDSDRLIWQGILNLIERSDFGKKDADAEVVVPLPPGTDEFQERISGGFDGVQMKALGICDSVLGEHGSVSLIPYSRGNATRSMILEFKSKTIKAPFADRQATSP